MKIRITTLSENTANHDYLAEWGLSILVEVDGAKILMDTGLSFSAMHNAQLMGIDISTIDRIVISHGHADHTGGLREVLRRRGDIDVIAHPDIWAAKYVRRDGEAKEQYIGIPFSREELESRGARFNLSREPIHITEHVMTTGEIPMLSGYEEIEGNLLVKQGETFHQDPLADDLALVIDADFGLVVILGCAHRGIINTLYHAQQLTGVKQIHMVLGGCHLIGDNEERIWQTITALKELGVQRIGVSHCTGLPAAVIMAHEFGDKFFFNNTGTRTNLL